MKRKLIVITVFFLTAHTSDAEVAMSGWTPESIATRVGYSAVRVDRGFAKVEALASWRLPFYQEFAGTWSSQWSLEASAGVLTRSERLGLVTSLGPWVRIGRSGWPVYGTAGIKGTLLGRNRYDEVNFGESFQFTSHIGIGLEAGRHWSVEYRLEHMSNANIAESNPGLNLHTITVSFKFN